MSIFKDIPAFLELFKEGKELSNAATWQNRTVAANIVAAFMGTVVVIARNSGYDLQLDQGTLSDLGMGIVALVGVVNAVMHTITSARVGVSADGGGEATAGAAADTDKPSEG